MSRRPIGVEEFADVFSGGTPSTGTAAFWDGGVPWITPKDLAGYELRYISSGERDISEEGLQHSSARLIPQDTVLLTTRAPIGYVALAGTPLATNQGFKNLVCKPEVAVPSFVYYLLKHNTKLLESHATGATFKELSGTRLKMIEFQFPDVDVQTRVASVLSAYDDLIENNNRRIQLLEESARLLYQEWFVRLRFPGYEHTSIVEGVPEGWGKTLLGEFVILNYGKALKADERIDGPFPVYGSSGIVGTHEKALTQGPGIIVGRKGNVGSVYWCSKNFYPIDTVYFIDSESSNLYLYYAIRHMHFISTDVAVPGLNRNFAYSRPLLLPSKSMLRSFLDVVSPLHEQIDKLDEMNQKLKSARDLLLPRLMSGEIVV